MASSLGRSQQSFMSVRSNFGIMTNERTTTRQREDSLLQNVLLLCDRMSNKLK